MRGAPFLLGFLVVAAAAPSPAAGEDADPRDRLLFERALRVGRNTATRHVTPEGVLAYEHRLGATPAQLSADALKKADTGIWTGCYAASVACRYAATRDAESLAEARRVSAGLHLLTNVTGVPGGVVRAVGRPIAGEERGTDVVDSPLGGGLAYRSDPSRDTLSGLVLGLTCLARFVDDPEVSARARSDLAAVALRLYRGGMKVRDADGRVTKHGELDAKVLDLFENGMHAAIGYATLSAARRYAGGEDLEAACDRLARRGWIDALDAQWTFLPSNITSASNMNMVHLALLSISLSHDGRPKRLALAAMRDFRRKTRGWQNGAYLSCSLLAGQAVDRDEMTAELRDALFTMPPHEVPFEGTVREEGGSAQPLSRRPVSVWAWKNDPFRAEWGVERATPSREKTYTRADWLFAYWLARAAGALDPGPAAGAGR